MHTGGAILQEPLSNQVEEARRLLTEANLLRLRGHFEEAIDNCTRLLRIDPSDAGAHSLLGDIYRAQGNDREALGWYKLAVQLNPANVADRKKLDEMIDRVFKAGQDDEATPYAHYTATDEYSAPVVTTEESTAQDWLRRFILKLQPLHVVIAVSVLTMLTVFIVLALRHNADIRASRSANMPPVPYLANPGKMPVGVPGQNGSITMGAPTPDVVEIGPTTNRIGLSAQNASTATVAPTMAEPKPAPPKVPTTPNASTYTPGATQPTPPPEPPKPPINAVGPAPVPGGDDSPGVRVTRIRAALATLEGQGSFLPKVKVKKVRYDYNNDAAEIDFRIPEMSSAEETKKGLLFAASHIAAAALLGEKLTDRILLRGYTSDEAKSFLGEIDRDHVDATKSAASYEIIEQNVTLPWWRDDLNGIKAW